MFLLVCYEFLPWLKWFPRFSVKGKWDSVHKTLLHSIGHRYTGGCSSVPALPSWPQLRLSAVRHVRQIMKSPAQNPLTRKRNKLSTKANWRASDRQQRCLQTRTADIRLPGEEGSSRRIRVQLFPHCRLGPCSLELCKSLGELARDYDATIDHLSKPFYKEAQGRRGKSCFLHGTKLSSKRSSIPPPLLAPIPSSLTLLPSEFFSLLWFSDSASSWSQNQTQMLPGVYWCAGCRSVGPLDRCMENKTSML